MPKMKTNRGAVKRFRKKGNGGVKRARANRRHILTKKAQKRKRQLRDLVGVANADAAAVKNMIGE